MEAWGTQKDGSVVCASLSIGFVGTGNPLLFRRGADSGFDLCDVFSRAVTAELEGTQKKVKINP